MFIACRNLQINGLDQRYFHIVRNQRYGEFGISRYNGATRLYIRRRAGAHDVGAIANTRNAVRVRRGAIQTVIAVIRIGFAPRFETAGEAYATCREAKDIAVGNAEIPCAKRRRADAVYIDQKGLNGGRTVRGTIAKRIIELIAAIERVVRIRGRPCERGLKQRVADGIFCVIVGARPRIRGRRIPFEIAPLSAHADQRADAVIGYDEGTRASIDWTIVCDTQCKPSRWHADQSGQTIGVGHAVERGWTKGIVIVGGRDRNDRTRNRRGLFTLSFKLGIIIAEFTKQFDRSDVLTEGAEKIDAVKTAADRAIGVFIVTQHTAGGTCDTAALQTEIAVENGA